MGQIEHISCAPSPARDHHLKRAYEIATWYLDRVDPYTRWLNPAASGAMHRIAHHLREFRKEYDLALKQQQQIPRDSEKPERSDPVSQAKRLTRKYPDLDRQVTEFCKAYSNSAKDKAADHRLPALAVQILNVLWKKYRQSCRSEYPQLAAPHDQDVLTDLYEWYPTCKTYTPQIWPTMEGSKGEKPVGLFDPTHFVPQRWEWRDDNWLVRGKYDEVYVQLILNSNVGEWKILDWDNFVYPNSTQNPPTWRITVRCDESFYRFATLPRLEDLPQEILTLQQHAQKLVFSDESSEYQEWRRKLEDVFLQADFNEWWHHLVHRFGMQHEAAAETGTAQAGTKWLKCLKQLGCPVVPEAEHVRQNKKISEILKGDLAQTVQMDVCAHASEVGSMIGVVKYAANWKYARVRVSLGLLEQWPNWLKALDKMRNHFAEPTIQALSDSPNEEIDKLRHTIDDLWDQAARHWVWHHDCQDFRPKEADCLTLIDALNNVCRQHALAIDDLRRNIHDIIHEWLGCWGWSLIPLDKDSLFSQEHIDCKYRFDREPPGLFLVEIALPQHEATIGVRQFGCNLGVRIQKAQVDIIVHGCPRGYTELLTALRRLECEGGLQQLIDEAIRELERWPKEVFNTSPEKRLDILSECYRRWYGTFRWTDYGSKLDNEAAQRWRDVWEGQLKQPLNDLCKSCGARFWTPQDFEEAQSGRCKTRVTEDGATKYKVLSEGLITRNKITGQEELMVNAWVDLLR